MDWRDIVEENKAPQVRSNNQVMNEIISQLFTYKRDMARRDESNCALLSENN